MDQISANNLDFLNRVLARLQRAGFAPLVFGGWAEELLGLSPARAHRDIDLLLPATSFAALDRFLGSAAAEDWREIAAKRFAHKRALLAEGVMVEFTLVEPGPVTHFWGDVEFRWLLPLAHDGTIAIDGVTLPTVSAANLLRYRELHRTTEPWRWRAPASKGG